MRNIWSEWTARFGAALGAGAALSCGTSDNTTFDSGTYLDAPAALPAQGYATSGDSQSLVGSGWLTGCVPKTCAMLGFTCGMNSDGCGGAIDCGVCPPGQFCGGGGYSRCGTGVALSDGGMACVAATCTALGDACGVNSDRCGGTVDCGACPSGQFCGGGGYARCGTGVTAEGGPACSPKTCAELHYNCGPAANGCGGILQCGTCPAPQSCGWAGYDKCGEGQANAWPDGGMGPPCTPQDCATLGIDCGPAGDGCGGQLQCGGCSGLDICGGGAKPGVCGSLTPCTNLCAKQAACDAGTPTTLTGTVFAGVSAWTGLAPDPVPNVLVFVPNAPLQAFTPGASCRECAADVSGAPLVSTYTNFDGTFALSGVPSGTHIPLVAQLGRWRRSFYFDVPECATTSVGDLNLPRNQSEGDIPLTAISTGDVDALECVLLKMGVDEAEFTPDSAAGGRGRVQIYAGDPGPSWGDPNGGAPGADVGPATRSEPALLGSGGTFSNYDQIMLPCWGAPAIKTATELSNLRAYSDSGGHFFATHYSYSWLVGNGEFNDVAQWVPDFDNPEEATWTLQVSALVPPDPPAPRVGVFAKWLNYVAALSNSAASLPGEPLVSIDAPRHDVTAVANGSVDWIDGVDQRPNSAAFAGNGTPLVEHFTFNTPVDGTRQCGHDIFSDFHVLNAGSGTSGQTFPAECDRDFSPQEKILEFMIWDLASCVAPPAPPTCTPIGCAAQNIGCGPAGDGCGGSIDCGQCPTGFQCGANGEYGRCVPVAVRGDGGACRPQTCEEQEIACGPAGDGCGGQLDCGTCTLPQTCGGCGKPGTCCEIGCTPMTCAEQNVGCGPAGDGCGNAIDCGSCPAGQTCGGGGVPGQCAGCTPLSCSQLDIGCGSVGDGCGRLLDCGTCPGATVCGGGGIPGQCGGTAR